MSHAKIATQLKSLNLLTQIDLFPFLSQQIKKYKFGMPVKAQAKPSLSAFFFDNSDIKQKTERGQLIFLTLLTDAFITPGLGEWLSL